MMQGASIWSRNYRVAFAEATRRSGATDALQQVNEDSIVG